MPYIARREPDGPAELSHKKITRKTSFLGGRGSVTRHKVCPGKWRHKVCPYFASMRHVLSKNGDIKFVHSLSPRGFEAQRADGARLHFLGRDGTQLLTTRVADDPLDALWIELAYAVGVIFQSPGSRRSRAPWVSVPSESLTPKVLNNSRHHVHETCITPSA